MIFEGFKANDTVEFLTAFQDADGYIRRGGKGFVKSDGLGKLGFVSVIAARRLWLCKPSEIRVIERRGK